jgi:hypothetical protein
LIRPAFGECGVWGAKPPFPAVAAATKTSAAPARRHETISLRRTRPSL